MVSHYRCNAERRLQTARTQQGVDGKYLNGIDYLEVSSDQTTLNIHLLQDLSIDNPLTEANVRITDDQGAIVTVDFVTSLQRVLTVRLKTVNFPAQFYWLRLVDSPLQLAKLGIVATTPLPPPQGFDSQLSRIRFALRSEDSSEVDCKTPEPFPDKPIPPPVIDYLAKDYASFRQLMLDRLTVTMPAWKERSPSDIGVMLVEILAYAADHLSYYQDAIATEAYLGTARRRMSVRRHARLLDYFAHDGCNARTWVFIKFKPSSSSADFDPRTDGLQLLGPSPEDNRPGARFFTRIPGLPVVLDPRDLILMSKALNTKALIYESLHDVTLYEPCNEIYFYTWGEENCLLPLGATQATLKDTGGKLRQCLRKDAVLIFEEHRNVETGEENQSDLTHRHAIRLTRVTPQEDPLLPEETSSGEENPNQKQRLLEIEWFVEDALPFELCISKRIDGKLYGDLSICRGNVVLVDHGLTRPDEALTPENLENAKTNANQDPKQLEEDRLNQAPEGDRYRPRLNYGPLTHQRYTFTPQGHWELFSWDRPAQETLGWFTPEPPTSRTSTPSNLHSRHATKEYKDEELAREALDQKRHFIKPSITLKQYNTQEFPWTYQPDLLNSDRFDRNFVVETEEDGRAYLRFGDDDLGKRPEAGSYFEVTYRTGNGTAGNVGAEAIAHIVAEQTEIMSVRNPLPAQGGIDPESLDQVRLYAPQAFRVPQRAVTEADYAHIAERYPDIQKVKATRRWTGSWHTVFLTVDRKGGRPLDEAFKQGLRSFLERFRMAGQDVEIEAPRFVPLRISMKVRIKPHYFRNSVKQALLETFSTQALPNGLLGFFHPDRLSFGQSIYLSQIIQTAVQVEGVQSVEVKEFQRWNQPAQGELSAGRITFGPLEIPQVNNEPANPSKGRIEFEMECGQ